MISSLLTRSTISFWSCQQRLRATLLQEFLHDKFLAIECGELKFDTEDQHTVWKKKHTIYDNKEGH